MGILDATATGALVKINIDGKPLEKLIEVVSNGIGTLYRPRKIRKEAEAQAYAIKVQERGLHIRSRHRRRTLESGIDMYVAISILS